MRVTPSETFSSTNESNERGHTSRNFFYKLLFQLGIVVLTGDTEIKLENDLQVHVNAPDTARIFIHNILISHKKLSESLEMLEKWAYLRSIFPRISHYSGKKLPKRVRTSKIWRRTKKSKTGIYLFSILEPIEREISNKKRLLTIDFFDDYACMNVGERIKTKGNLDSLLSYSSKMKKLE